VVPLDNLLAFALAAFAIIVVPGPSVLFVISRGVTLGRRAALATVLGNCLGVYVQVVAVAVGIGSVVERSIAVFTVIKFVGAAYLVYLGVKAFRHRRALAGALVVGSATPMSRSRIVREGFIVGVTNPKAMIFFAAILPQFVDRSAGAVPPQLLVLGVVFVLIAFVSDGTWGLAAGTAREWLVGSPKRLAVIGGTGGLVMIGLGMRLALTGRKD
jgi:threonine/homoserine/homoserine lactone efflux protein